MTISYFNYGDIYSTMIYKWGIVSWHKLTWQGYSLNSLTRHTSNILDGINPSIILFFV